MARPTKHAGVICTILGIVALAGIVLGILLSAPLITIVLLIPTAVYEVYRTGRSSLSRGHAAGIPNGWPPSSW